jgi:hypothetical protein
MQLLIVPVVLLTLQPPKVAFMIPPNPDATLPTLRKPRRIVLAP